MTDIAERQPATHPAPDILCLGEALVEFTRQPDGTWLQGFGGDTSNAAIAAARQGASVGYLSAVGADRFGAALLDLWQADGIDTSHVHRAEDASTGLYFVDPDPAERHFTYYRAGSAASRYGPDDLPGEALRRAKALHVSGITLAISDTMRAAGLAAMREIRKAGGIASLDTNLRLKLWPVEDARQVLDQAMTETTIAITSIDDSAHLTGLTDPEAIVAHYQRMGPETVIVTCGAEGARIGHGRARHEIAAAPASPVDSTGAGDSFSGSFLAYYLETGSVATAADRAAVVAAGTVSGLGAIAPIPRRAAVLERSNETSRT